jgi:hypothetical protein
MWDDLSDVRKYNYPDTFQKHDCFKEIIFNKEESSKNNYGKVNNITTAIGKESQSRRRRYQNKCMYIRQKRHLGWKH